MYHVGQAMAFAAEGGSLFGWTATEEHIPEIEDLILTHGASPWNHLPEDHIHEHVAAIGTDSTLAIMAKSTKTSGLLGVVTYEVGHRYPDYQPANRRDSEHGYIAEVVTHADRRGRGIGGLLLGTAIEDLTSPSIGMREVYAMRHADNVPSQRIMEKCGMVLVDEFADPDIRPTGSGKTAVMRYTA